MASVVYLSAIIGTIAVELKDETTVVSTFSSLLQFILKQSTRSYFSRSFFHEKLPFKQFSRYFIDISMSFD